MNVAHTIADQQRRNPSSGGAAAPDRALLSDKRVEEALGAVQRAVATSQFYPPNHPLRLDAVREGFRAWQAVESDHRLEDTGLRLRDGTLWLGDARLGEGSPAVLSLARAFSLHGLACVVRKEALPLEGFSRLVELLAAAPDGLSAQGGILGAWKRTEFGELLWLRQLSVAAAAEPTLRDRGTGRVEEWGKGLSEGAELSSLADPLLTARLKGLQKRGPKERRLLDLLVRLSRTEEISAFLSLLKEIATLTQEYVDAERFREALQVVVFLYREAQNLASLGESGRRDYLIECLRLIVRGSFLLWLVGFVVSSPSPDEDAEVGEYVLRALGTPAVVPLVNALVTEKDRRARRKLVDILVAAGDPVVPIALKMLDDQRWYVVRNMVTILGGIGSPESLRALARVARDPDPRIRREAVRAVSRVEGMGAEEALLAFLEDADPGVRLMAISSSAGRRSGRLLAALTAMFRAIGLRSPDWSLKAPILQAVGRLGLSEGCALLEEVLNRRPFFGRRRWEALQVGAVQALGELGGDRARQVLEGLHRSPCAEVRQAAGRALTSLGEAGSAEDD